MKDTKDARTQLENTVRSFASSTLTNHISAWNDWKDWCQGLVSPGSPTTADIASYLGECLVGQVQDRSTQTRTGASNKLASLVWFGKHAGASSVAAAVEPCWLQDIARADSVEAGDRKESLAFPLSTILKLEERVVSQDSTEAEKILLGGFLSMTWWGLRFMDAQRCRPDSVLLERSIIRGNCWGTKSSKRGQPFGCMGEGASGTSTAGCWGQAWLQALHGWCHREKDRLGRSIDLDFLLPDFIIQSSSKDFELLPRPISYTKASSLLRRTLCARWMGAARMNPVEAKTYTLHGLKATVLSWARQLDVRADLRGDQGHHRQGKEVGAVSLYSRDDVWGALRCQSLTISSTHAGFRPLTPLGRGGQHPREEVEASPCGVFTSHIFTSDVEKFQTSSTASVLSPPLDTKAVSDDESSSGSSSSSSSPECPQRDEDEDDAFFLGNSGSRIYHRAQKISLEEDYALGV